MNKKLRLIVTSKCNRNCLGCCNKNWIGAPPTPIYPTKITSYDEVYLTGGEPMLFSKNIFNLLSSYSLYKPKFFIYTAFLPDDITNLQNILNHCHNLAGITFTVHDWLGIVDLIRLNELIKLYPHLSLHLNIFTDIQIPVIDLYQWKVKFIEWKQDCPLPEGEDFGILLNAWK